MSEGFWSLRNAPKWWFDKRAWALLAVFAVVLIVDRWHYGPGRVPAGQVVLYGATWCPYSAALREHLVASGIPFEERNIDESWGNLHRYLWAAGRGGRLPTMQIGPKTVTKGFHRRDVDLALREAGFKPSTGPSGAEGGSERR